uniref:ribosomal protein L22 n=1 Tax=Euglena deses TaxID=66845 RepID=UPI0023AAA9B5|nr:ribosomal protein L22 [Euglena deses]WCH63369.1 ribosomal protein L22 [Euglena deses]
MRKKEKLEATSFSRYIRMSPSKIRRVLNQLTDRTCEEAFILLKFLPLKSSPIISKVLNSAVSNYNQMFNVTSLPSSLKIIEARVDSGPILKRFCPHAQGRGFPIKKQTSHIISVV